MFTDGHTEQIQNNVFFLLAKTSPKSQTFETPWNPQSMWLNEDNAWRDND